LPFPGHIEILIVIFLFLALFAGPSKISGLIKPLSKGINEYKKLSSEVNELKQAFSVKNLLDGHESEKEGRGE